MFIAFIFKLFKMIVINGVTILIVFFTATDLSKANGGVSNSRSREPVSCRF